MGEELKQAKGGVRQMFENLANRKNKENEDYYENGILMCGKCHTRKQIEVESLLFGGKRKITTMCKCEEEEFDRERQMKKELELRQRIEKLRKTGIIDRKYLKYRLENDDKANEKVSKAVRKYIENFEKLEVKNLGLLFYGDVGVGKSFYAGCIANSLLDKGIKVIMSNVPMLVTMMGRDFEADKEETLDKISKVNLLILDDLGIERKTDYGYEKLQEIIDTRYRSGKPLIVTTNLTPQNLKKPEDSRYKRVYDRVLEMCYPIWVQGESRRLKEAARKRREAKEILEI